MFAPAVDQGVTSPVYAYGHGRLQDPVFTCPVSAIPEIVWEILDLWFTCRSMKALPYAGGVLDQPYVLRRAWPILEAAIAPLERQAPDADAIGLLAAAIGLGGARR